MLVDADALIVGSEVTTRCALHDFTIGYLSPLEQVGALLRLEEIQSALAPQVDDISDRLAGMRAEASAIPCGHEGLVPFMDFSRQVARDVIDIALTAWQDIDILRCNYFADDDFLVAAERARTAGEAAIEGEANRVAYIEQRAAAWVAIFDSNCTNLGFDPTLTLPGRIALAVPTQ